MINPEDTSGNGKSENPLLRKIVPKPIAEVETSIGKVFLFPERYKDALSELKASNPVDLVREILPNIGNLQSIPTDIAGIGMSKAEIDKLSGIDIEAIASSYASSAALDSARSEIQKIVDEQGSSYLSRLLREERERTLRQAQDMLQSFRQPFAFESALEMARKSSGVLGETLDAFDHLSKPTEPLEARIESPAYMEAFDAHRKQLQEDREEELELARITGKMTADSAKALKDLVDAATALMVRLDKRDMKSDHSTRRQIWIALITLAASVVLAIVAAVFAGLSFYQDRANNADDNAWQAELKSAVIHGNEQRSSLETENLTLRNQVDGLNTRIAELEAAQRAAFDGEANKDADQSNDTPADLPPTKHGSTRSQQ